MTAGNASGINDGAAARRGRPPARRRRRSARKPLARILSYVSTGVDPKIMGMGPVPAVRKVLERAGLTIGDVDLFELNEAFAAQSVAVDARAGLDPAKVNVNGGAIALGHPIGASGARVLTTLIYALRARKLRYGVASLCIGGGMGIAMAIRESGIVNSEFGIRESRGRARRARRRIDRARARGGAGRVLRPAARPRRRRSPRRSGRATSPTTRGRASSSIRRTTSTAGATPGAAGSRCVGFYHSHPRSAATPSATDRAEASYPDHLYLIVSLAARAAGSRPVQARRCRSGNFLRLPFVTVG